LPKNLIELLPQLQYFIIVICSRNYNNHQGTVVTGSAIIDFEFLSKTVYFVYNFRGKDQKMWFLGHFLLKNEQVFKAVALKISL